MKSGQRVIGLDPGVATTGFAVLEVDERIANHYRVIDYGVITTASHRTPGERLKEIHDRVAQLLEAFAPELAAVEKIYFSKNVKTAMAVGEARGVLLMVLSERGIPAFDINPVEVKKNVAGTGKATKKQVQQMVTRILNLPEIPKPDDAADALAIAISGLRLAPWRARIEEKQQ